MSKRMKPPTSWQQHLVELENMVGLGMPPNAPVRELKVPAKKAVKNSAAELPPVATWQRSKTYMAGAALATAVVLTGWGLGSVYLSKITVGNQAVRAHVSDAALAAAVSKQVTAYKLTIQYPDGQKKHYSLDKLGLTLDNQASLLATRKAQHHLAQRVQWWRPLSATLVYRVNRATFDSFVAQAANVTVQPSKDAVLSIDKGEITIADAVTGKQYGLARPQVLKTAAASLQPAPIKLRTIKVSPALTAQALEPYKASLQKIIAQPVTFSVADRNLTPSPAEIASWLEITPDDTSKKVDITVDSGKILEYINRAVRSDIHPPKAEVHITQPDGTSQVVVTGVDGVDIPNKSAVSTAVAKGLLSGENLSQTLSITNQPFQTITAGNYDKWIEVDLTNKRTYAYEKTTLVRTELVSAGTPATPTVTGQYNIYAKFAQQDMRGNNVDGSKYFQPHVQWINYFYQDYAIHGNYWRPLSYFGNINSSHGCVSMVDDEAAWIYDWAPLGTPVIIHT